MKIDSHQHFWNFDWLNYSWPTKNEEAIFRNIEANELEPLLKKAGIDKTVIVQADDSYADTVYMLETASKKEWVAGVVGWVPLDKPGEANAKLEEFSKNPYFKGVRHLIHMYDDPDWIVKDVVIEGLQVLASYDLTFDLVAIFPNHINHVSTLVERVPNLKIVVDHLAKPPIKDKIFDPWAERMRIAASYTNVYAKISGLNTTADPENWTAADFQPYIEEAIRCFGADRLMFGSDWPVANLAGDYLKVWTETNKALEGRSTEEINAILGETAIKFYKL
ncbi:amidohydrolase family protein [Paenibacillus abyssi]|uniref:Metal-dependent hydrolase n=1 Tax=Paenibacillus abyssi TaxID=1340531 RepID=A0A917CWL9_9BACL|nr:amidohydrolase family protein [Paenibacillus abyssi]GGG00200.1 metal-dependent hydrolase [Paenibacillus abyssi]